MTVLNVCSYVPLVALGGSVMPTVAFLVLGFLTLAG